MEVNRTASGVNGRSYFSKYNSLVIFKQLLFETDLESRVITNDVCKKVDFLVLIDSVMCSKLFYEPPIHRSTY